MHGPTAADRRAANAAREDRPHHDSDVELDAALRLASADPRVFWPARVLAWTVSAYNRAPPRVFLEGAEPALLVIGVVPAAGRWLAFLCLGRERAASCRAAARGAPPWSSGWPGAAVLAAVWGGGLLLFLWAFRLVGDGA